MDHFWNMLKYLFYLENEARYGENTGDQKKYL